MDELSVCSARIVSLPDDCSEEDRWRKIRDICKEVFTTMICGISYMKKVKMRRINVDSIRVDKLGFLMRSNSFWLGDT